MLPVWQFWSKKFCGRCRSTGKCFVWIGYDVQKLGDSTIYECLVDGLEAEKATLKTEIDRLALLPSNINLVGAEVDMMNLEDRENIMKKVLAPGEG